MATIMSTANHVFQDPQPLTVKSYTIALDKDEQSLAVPICLRPRVAQAKYTWSLFLGAASPDARSGSQGDVWVTTIPRYENVYIRGESDQWNVWHKTINYGEKRYCNDEKKFLHSYHPWLRDRLLQFNGTDLGWHRRRFFNHHRVSWNTTRASGHPEYESLDSVAVARYMKPLHLPRPTLFGRIQPAASTSSFSVPPVTPTARPAQPGHPMLPRPTVPGGVQLAAPSSSYNLQPTTTLPVQQGHTLPTPTVPGGVQPAASTNLPSVTTARPAPLGQPMLPRPAVPRVVQPATRSSSTSFPPVTTALSAQPAQPTLRARGLTFTGVKVQPAAPASSSSLPTVTTATRPAPPAQPMPPKPTVSGGAQTAAPSLTPKTGLPTQLGQHFLQVHCVTSR
ncbi:hypothetical protein LXA43DRAFT_1002722 [Ganoderma leucocontextum]|nr:hypothetical protein LXA43DRAFT_1002722 [Ganoderma leucocontextum]